MGTKESFIPEHPQEPPSELESAFRGSVTILRVPKDLAKVLCGVSPAETVKQMSQRACDLNRGERHRAGKGLGTQTGGAEIWLKIMG